MQAPASAVPRQRQVLETVAAGVASPQTKAAASVDAGHGAGVTAVMAARRDTRDEAARALWYEHYAHLAGWCAALVGDTDAAHDIASEAFTRLLSRWYAVRDPRGFLYVTATNLVRDRWRKEKRDRVLAARLGRQEPDCTPATDPWLRDLVQRLPERMREPVLLHYYADMPVCDVAAALHRPEGTIKRSLAEARGVLHVWMERAE